MSWKIKITLLLFFISFEQNLAQEVSFMPQWLPQSQFAGYYIAQKKGFYKEEGLDVSIKHMSKNSVVSLDDNLVKNNIDIVSMTLLQAIVARSQGKELVNILQLGQNNPNYCITTKPVKSIKDLDGASIVRWKIGSVNIFDLIFAESKVKINWVISNDPTNLYLFNAADAILACSYNEYYKLISNVGKIDDKCILKASEMGYNYPTDGLYVTEEYYQKNKLTLKKFIRATIRGWQYAFEHEDEAIACSNEWKHNTGNSFSNYQNKMMLTGVLDMLKDHESGIMSFAPVSRDIFDQMNRSLLNFNMISHLVTYEELIKTDLLNENHQ